MPVSRIYKSKAQRLELLHRVALHADDCTLTDAEILELHLSQAPEELDTGSLSARLLATFGSLSHVLNADAADLQAVDGMTTAAVLRLKLVSLTLRRTLRSNIGKRSVIGSWDILLKYCSLAMGDQRIEQFRVLFLNHQHALLADEVMGHGTINFTPAYPREIIRRALQVDAAALILVHNHPTGDTRPSLADIRLTAEIVDAASTVNIHVYDHVIIGRSA